MITIEDITDIEINGVDLKDYPKFTDAYIVSAKWVKTGLPLKDNELDWFTDAYADIVNRMALNTLCNASDIREDN